MLMRNLIAILNLLAALSAACLSSMSLFFSPGLRSGLQAAGYISWVVCAFWLWKGQSLWAWLGSLMAVCAVAVLWGAELTFAARLATKEAR